MRLARESLVNSHERTCRQHFFTDTSAVFVFEGTYAVNSEYASVAECRADVWVLVYSSHTAIDPAEPQSANTKSNILFSVTLRSLNTLVSGGMLIDAVAISEAGRQSTSRYLYSPLSIEVESLAEETSRTTDNPALTVTTIAATATTISLGLASSDDKEDEDFERNMAIIVVAAVALCLLCLITYMVIRLRDTKELIKAAETPQVPRPGTGSPSGGNPSPVMGQIELQRELANTEANIARIQAEQARLAAASAQPAISSPPMMTYDSRTGEMQMAGSPAVQPAPQPQQVPEEMLISHGLVEQRWTDGQVVNL